MGALIHRLSAWDGLTLHVREWNGGAEGAPLLCLPGLVRTGGDFESLVPLFGAGRRIVSLDYAGRGDSGRSRDLSRYAPEACVRDIMDVCAALHLHDVIVVGTSFGGLLGCALAAARPALLRAIILNDIGPEVGRAGAAFVRDFIGHDPALESLDACVAFLRARLPPLSLSTEAEWRAMAALTYRQGDDGRFHPAWDIGIAETLDRPVPDLWPLFDGLAGRPVLLAHGEASEILLSDTVARMRSRRPDMMVVSLPGIGHAPTLTEPPVAAAIARFLQRVA
jgi:pimeloyl-ACP methyl ester carboxylesterase